MTIDNIKNGDSLKETLTQKDSVGLKKIYDEFKEAEKNAGEESKVELSELKLIVGNETIYVMQYGEGYLIEKGDTISHINALLPKGYSIKVANPRKIFSGDNLRVAIKNNKLVINGKTIENSAIKWGEDDEAKAGFENYKANKWAKECFMTFDSEKQEYKNDEGDLIVNASEINTLNDLKQKTAEYREKKEDEKASQIAKEAGVDYNSENNYYIYEGNHLISRDRVKNIEDILKAIEEYKENLATEQARTWAEELNIGYDQKRKLYLIDQEKLTIKRDDVLVKNDLVVSINEYNEGLADEEALEIAKEVGVVYDKESNFYVYEGKGEEGGKMTLSRSLIKNAKELKGQIDDYKEKLAEEKATKIAQTLDIIYNIEEKCYIAEHVNLKVARDSISNIDELQSMINERVLEMETSQPAFLKYTVKGGDYLWKIIKDNYKELGLTDNKSKTIGDYYKTHKEDIVSINNLRLSKKGDPIIIKGKEITLPTLCYVATEEVEPIEKDVQEIEKQAEKIESESNEILESIKPKESKELSVERKAKLMKDIRIFLETQGTRGIDIKAINAELINGVETINVYLKDQMNDKRVFEIAENGFIVETEDSSKRNKFDKYIKGLLELDNITVKDSVFLRKSGENSFEMVFKFDLSEVNLKREFQLKEDGDFKETTDPLSLGQIEVCKAAAFHGLKVLSLELPSFAKKYKSEGKEVDVYKLRVKAPHEEASEGYYYVNPLFGNINIVVPENEKDIY